MPTTKNKLDCNERHLAKLDRVVMRLYKDGSDGITKEQLEAVAAQNGKSLNAWMISVLKDAVGKKFCL